MKNKYTITEQDAKEHIEALEGIMDLMTERISDLCDIRGGAAERHAFLLYRREIVRASNKFQEKLNINQ